MSRYNGRSQGALSILAVVLLVILVLGLAGGLFPGKNGGKESSLGGVTVFYNGYKLSNGDIASFRANFGYRFEVKNVLGMAEKNFSVTVIPYGTKSTAFNYTVSGSTYTWDDHITGDLSAMFDVTPGDGYFVWGITSSNTMLQYLQHLHPQEEVVLTASPDMSQNPYFAIRVSSGDNVTIIPFRIQGASSGSSGSGGSSGGSGEGTVLLTGEWTLNDHLSLKDIGAQKFIDCRLAGGQDSVNSITVSALQLVMNVDRDGVVIVYDSTGYLKTGYKTFAMPSSGEYVSAAFYNWLIANAKKTN